MEQEGYFRGISPSPSFAQTIDGLTNEKVIVSEINGCRVPSYPLIVAQSDRIAVIGYKGSPIEPKIDFQGYFYVPTGPARETELLQWIPYKKSKPSGRTRDSSATEEPTKENQNSKFD
jgi:hypothetical protein